MNKVEGSLLVANGSQFRHGNGLEGCSGLEFVRVLVNAKAY
jgi:hypothetical protein